MKNIKYALVLLFFSSIFAGCENKSDADSIRVENIIPKSIELVSSGEQKIKVTKRDDKYIFENYKDKVVLVEFFTTWCPSCKVMIPHLSSLQSKYKDNIVVIGVLLEDKMSNSDVNNYIKQQNISYTITNSKANFDMSRLFGGVRGIPAMYLIGKDGSVKNFYAGAERVEIIEQDILKAIK